MVNRQSIIQAYGEKAMTRIIDDLGVQGFNARTRTGLCPFHNEKTGSFTFNMKTNTFHCFGCGENVDIISHYMDYENLSFIQAVEKACNEAGIISGIESNKQMKRIEEKQYIKPTISTEALNSKMVQHFEERGISKATLEYWRVKSAINNFRVDKDKWDKRKCFVFECYDDNNELIHSSYRTSNKLFAQSKGTKAILWGQWHIDPTKTLYITEGQIDAMSIWQAGIKNVVSIPSGAANRNYLELNYEFLNQFEEIVFWIDDDNPGRIAGDNLKSKFQDARIIFHKEFKDANEVLMNLGHEEINRFLSEKPPLPTGIKGIDEAGYSIDEPTEEQRIETGFSEFDEHVEDWRLQQLSIVFGRDNEGKSTFMSQVITHQLKKRVKTFLFSAELGDQSIQDWLYRQLIGTGKNCFVKKQGKYKEKFYLKPEVLKGIRKYTKDHLYIIDNTNDEILQNNETLFKGLKVLAIKFGVKLFVLDNLQSVMIQKHSDVNRDQSQFAERCRQFAKKHNVHVVLVAHPHKIEELTADETTEVGNLKKDNISGSKDISNKAHNIISIERDFSGEHFDMILTNLKDKNEGRRKGFKYFFDKDTNRFYSDLTVYKQNLELEKLIPRTETFYNGTKQTFEGGEMCNLEEVPV